MWNADISGRRFDILLAMSAASTPRRYSFRLRTLFVLTALAALAIYWLMLPTLQARRFIRALDTGEFDVAERMCVPETGIFPGGWKNHTTFESHPVLEELRWRDLLRGERPFFIGIKYGDNSGTATCGLECRATRSGIEIVHAFP